MDEKISHLERWYFVTYQIDRYGKSTEHSIYSCGLNEAHAIDKGMSAYIQSYPGIKRIEFVNIREAMPHEQKTLNAEL